MDKKAKKPESFYGGFQIEIIRPCNCGKKKNGIARKIIVSKQFPMKDGTYLKNKRRPYFIGKNGIVRIITNELFCQECSEKDPFNILHEVEKTDRLIERKNSR